MVIEHLEYLIEKDILHASAMQEYEDGTLDPEILGKYLSQMCSIDGCGPFLNKCCGGIHSHGR